MADTTDHSAPSGYDLYAGYVDGGYRSYPFLSALYPGRTIAITVVGDPRAHIEDVETGDVTPAHSPYFVRAKGKTRYCLWVASYGVSRCPVPGAMAWQRIDHGPHGENIDVSEVYDDGWPYEDVPTIYCPASWASTVQWYCSQAGLIYVPANTNHPLPPPPIPPQPSLVPYL